MFVEILKEYHNVFKMAFVRVIFHQVQKMNIYVIRKDMPNSTIRSVWKQNDSWLMPEEPSQQTVHGECVTV